MNDLLLIAIAGGLFSVLAFIHFVSDFIFQSHDTAMTKHNKPWVRAKHCLVYTVFFVPWMMFFHFHWWGYLIGLNVLFWSHFVEDTYLPVFLWAKFIRKPRDMHYFNDSKGFRDFIETPLGKILMISVDQIIHLSFLWIIVVLTMVN